MQATSGNLSCYTTGLVHYTKMFPGVFSTAKMCKRASNLPSVKPTMAKIYCTIGTSVVSNLRDIPGVPIWLRHHCRCEECFNSKTNQRIIIPSSLRESTIVNAEKVMVRKHHEWRITWSDKHVSRYKASWLEENLSGLLKQNNRLGTLPNFDYFEPKKVSIKDVPESPLDTGISYKAFMEDEESLKKFLGNIRDYGYGVLINAPATAEDTLEAIHRISHVQNTIYGGFWEFQADMTFPDSAYTSDFVHSHTDTTYFTEPIGLQVLHCLNHEGEGGLSSIVDGYDLAYQIFSEYPRYYKILQSTFLPWEYVDDGKQHFNSVAPIFHHNAFSGKLECVRYNPHDLGTLNTVEWSLMPELYDCLIYLSDKIQQNAQWFKLEPGTIIFMNNWRVLHGRNEFTGIRKICGAYISRSDFLSRSRVLLKDEDENDNKYDLCRGYLSCRFGNCTCKQLDNGTST